MTLVVAASTVAGVGVAFASQPGTHHAVAAGDDPVRSATGGATLAATGNHTDGNDTEGENETDGNTTDADNETDGNQSAAATAGPVEGMPAGVANFTDTRPLTGTQADPSSLAGKLRVESEHAANTTVELVRNSSTDYELAINVTGNATNVSFYLQSQAVASSQNISNVTAYLDGEPLAFGVTEASNSGWIGFEVDHFSTRNVTFTSADAGGSTDDASAVVANYADASGAVDTGGLQNALADWSGGGLTTRQLVSVIEAWAAGG